MKRYLLPFVVAVGLTGLASGPALAADGDGISGESWTWGNFFVQGFLLCDNQGNGDCDEFDLNAVGSSSLKLGVPKYMRFAMEETTAGGDCTAGTFMPKGRDAASGGDSTDNTYDLLASVLDITGDTQAIIAAPLNRYILGTVAAISTCTHMDVRLYLYYEQTGVQ